MFVATPIKSRKNRKKKSESKPKPKKCSCSGKPMGNKIPCTFAQCHRKGQVRLFGRKLAEK